MVEQLFYWVLDIPQAVAQFGDWLTSPLNAQYFNISPLGLLGVGGGATIVAIITIHIVKLFV